MKAKAIEPTLVISESRFDVGPSKLLIIGCVRGGLEPRVDKGALGFGEEGCGERVIVNKEVGEEGDNNGQESFL